MKLYYKRYKCKECATKGVLNIKMGGLICKNCRIILFYPDSLEYKEHLKIMREKSLQE